MTVVFRQIFGMTTRLRQLG